MKKLLFLLLVILFCGCSGSSSNNDMSELKVYLDEFDRRIYTVDIEGHVYIIYSAGYKGGIVHAEHCPCKNVKQLNK